MEKTLINLIIFLAVFRLSGQEENIYIETFPSQQDCYLSGKNFVFYEKYYSVRELLTKDVSMNFFQLDTLLVNNESKSETPHKYFIRREYQKDSLEPIFRMITFRIVRNPTEKNQQKLQFKAIPQKLVPYQCNEVYYNDLQLLKTFVNTSAFVKNENNELNIYLVGSRCKVVHQEKLHKDAEFFEAEDILILKTLNEYIFVFDKY